MRVQNGTDCGFDRRLVRHVHHDPLEQARIDARRRRGRLSNFTSATATRAPPRAEATGDLPPDAAGQIP